MKPSDKSARALKEMTLEDALKRIKVLEDALKPYAFDCGCAAGCGRCARARKALEKK